MLFFGCFERRWAREVMSLIELEPGLLMRSVFSFSEIYSGSKVCLSGTPVSNAFAHNRHRLPSSGVLERVPVPVRVRICVRVYQCLFLCLCLCLCVCVYVYAHLCVYVYA